MGYLHDRAKKVRYNIDDAVDEIDSFLNLLDDCFTVNGKPLNKGKVNEVRDQLADNYWYARYTVCPTALESDSEG